MVDPPSQTVALRNIDVARYEPNSVVVSQGLEAGEIVVTAGVQALRPGQKVRLLGGVVMSNFNLSEWAVRHRSLVVYFMLVLAVAGVGSYLRLGRNEDPAFTIRTMVVQANWPGATIQDTLQQVTERLERKLQETPNLDYLRSYTSAGQTTIFVNLKGSTPGKAIPDIWYQVRKKIGDIRNTLPQGIVGPGFNDEFGDTYGIVYGFTADGFSHRQLKDHVEDVRSRLLQVPDVSKIDVVGAQDEKIYVEFSTEQMAGLGINRQALMSALQAQNAVTPAGVVQTGDEKLLIRVTGSFRAEQDILGVNFVANGRMIRLSDIAQVTRGYADPPQPLFRVNGVPAIGLAIAMRDGGDILALGKNIERTMAEITANLPVGIEPKLVADQPVTVEHAVHEFMKALWEAIAIVLAVSFVSLGRAGRGRGGALDPARPRDGVPGHGVHGHRPAADLARRPHHRARPARRRCHDHGRDHDHAPGARRRPRARRYVRLHLDGVPDADRHPRHRGGVRADRLRPQFGRRVHLLDLRRGRHRADRVLDRRGRVLALARRRDPEEAEARPRSGARSDPARLPRRSGGGHASALADHPRHPRAVRGGHVRDALRAPAVLPRFGPTRTAGRPEAAPERLDLRQPRRLGAAG